MTVQSDNVATGILKLLFAWDCQQVGERATQFQRIPLPGTEFLEEEPLYVNAKQYKRILKRRQARAKLDAEGKILKRQVW